MTDKDETMCIYCPEEGTQLVKFTECGGEWLLIVRIKGWIYSVVRSDVGFKFLPFSLDAPHLNPAQATKNN